MYRRKFKPSVYKAKSLRTQEAKKKKKLYSDNWDNIRKMVYARDGYRCAMCGKKGKLHAHHIVPVKISHDNSLNNLVAVCEKCHRKLEAVGFKILKEGGGTAMLRRMELKMIAEAKQERLSKYIERSENGTRENDHKSVNEDYRDINRNAVNY